jgi:hypothetical protein
MPPPTATTGVLGNYELLADTGTTITWGGDQTNAGGVMTVQSDAANESVGIQSASAPFQIDYGYPKRKLWFEARVKREDINATEIGFYVGLLESAALAVDVPLDTDGAITDNNLVGFVFPEGDMDDVDFYYKAGRPDGCHDQRQGGRCCGHLGQGRLHLRWSGQ